MMGLLVVVGVTRQGNSILPDGLDKRFDAGAQGRLVGTLVDETLALVEHFGDVHDVDLHARALCVIGALDAGLDECAMFP
jgi:hypothetical protein